MKINSIRVTRGPNYWSTYRKHLIVMVLDLEELEQFPTNKIDGFAERLEALIPSLHEHRCSEKKPGGFFERVKQGTWMGHVIEHIALELQSLAGMPCGFGRTRSTSKKGVYNVVFCYTLQRAGIYAAKAAVNIAQALIDKQEYDIQKDVDELVYINKREGLGPSTQSIINEARRRNIPYRRLDTNSSILFGQGKYQKTITATVACTTSNLGVELASHKQNTRKLLSENHLPVADGRLVTDVEELKEAVEAMGFPLVIKPVNGNHGRGVKVNICSEEVAVQAFENASKISSRVLVERFVEGHDYRFLVIDFKLCAVARRTPAAVVGNGRSTIQQLVDDANNDPRRGEHHEKVLTTIKIDHITQAILDEKGFTVDTVLPNGEILFLKDAANLSAGGTATDVTDIVHPANVFLAERAARLMNLDICGIDVIAKDIASPITRENGAIIEVNAGPGFRMHLSPTRGTPRNVAEPVMNMLFPPGTPSRIPIIAVTGTNGKTTTTRLTAHLAKTAGHTVGFTTTDGIYIQDQQVYSGDCSGPSSADTVLRDPSVDFAVLECARGGLLRSGLGFDQCDISIITNITEDHLGLDDINTLSDLVKVKSVVARSTSEQGYAVLNADDDRVYGIAKDLDCQVALFSITGDNERVKEHCDGGGWAAIIEKGYFTLCRGEWKTRIGKVNEIPLTQDGAATCMIKNILPAMLAAALSGFDVKTIRRGLQTFIPGPDTTPGRMNLFTFPHYTVLMDYAHNADGFAQLEQYLQQVKATVKTGIITCPGDRRDEDLVHTGYCAAKMFDRIIIRHDKNCRGRKPEEITELITRGIAQVDEHKLEAVISNELEALSYAMEHAPEDAFIVLYSDTVQQTIGFLKKEQEKAMETEERWVS